MNIALGLFVTLGCMLAGYVWMGGHVAVIWQPAEYLIICGAAIGTFIVANPMKVIKDTGKGIVDALKNSEPKESDYLAVLGFLYALMREFKNKPKSEVEKHIDDPSKSSIFAKYPEVLARPDLTQFICDYARLHIMGSARPAEIEALMDEEIQTIRHDGLKPYHALHAVSEAFPALGIVAAVLGVIKAMAALDKPPEVLGELIASAMVGTFAGIFLSYAVVAPIATKLKTVREKQLHLYMLVKQTFLAFMNGAMASVAVEHGRKMISAHERPTINRVEESLTGTPEAKAA
ncbi:flagellar motor stator protein MotA [Rhodomicrobium vannielii ATCC 17100]|uniref:flagellar motor stator protein MotA n=1 Tax=Rhodomicrobium vannielii TaxID=1069 RepID=UPI001918E626|nr:flagellar motor stator protein MotA [Rhodomicrobium vannielii ATCC 17100]